MLILILAAIHIIGAIITVVLHYRDGTMKIAKKYGDGIKIKKFSDIVFQDVFLWEILLLVFLMDNGNRLINDHVKWWLR